MFGKDGRGRWIRLPARVLDRLTRLSALTGSAALAVIVFAYVFEVTARYFFTAPTDWAHDLVRYLLGAVVFLMAPEVARAQGHVAITFLVERLESAARAVVSRLLATVSGLAAGAAAGIVVGEAIRQFERGIVTIAVHPIPKWWISGIIAFGLLLTALQFLRQAGARRPAES